MNYLSKQCIIATILIIVLIVPLSFGLVPTKVSAEGHDVSSDVTSNAPTTGEDPLEAFGGSGSTIATAGGVLSCLGGGFFEGAIGTAARFIGQEVPTGDSLNRINTATIKNKDCVLDGLTTVIREVLLSKLTSSIVNWVNNGFEGEPAFITDLEGFLLNVGDEAIGEYIYGSKLNRLCSPFRDDVRRALAINLNTTTRDRTSCTLTSIIQNLGIEDAFDNLPPKDAWNLWHRFSTNPYNNAFGAFIKSRQEVQQSVAVAQTQAQTEVGWGNGFQSYKICEKNSQSSSNGIANIIRGVNCKTATPGVVISQQINRVVSSGFNQIENADEIGEIIGLLLGQLSQQVLGGSLGGFSGLSSSSNGRPAYVDQITESSDGSSEAEFRDYGISIVDGSISTENQYISTKNVSLARLNTSENLLNALSQCYLDKLPTPQRPNSILTLEQQTEARARAATATSTIASNITPLQTLISGEIEQAEDTISRLLVIKENLKNASSRLAVERILDNELDPLVEGRIIHSQPDFVVAQQQREDIEDITEAMDEATNVNLEICEVFPLLPVEEEGGN